MGQMRVVRSPARFGGEPLPVSGHAPAHGQDTEAVLASFGVSPDSIKSMKEDGVIG